MFQISIQEFNKSAFYLLMVKSSLILCVAGESVYVRHVQLQREKVRTAGASPAGWLHCGLQRPPAR